MDIIYDEDAAFFAYWLRRKLLRAGYVESSLHCETVLKQLEAELPNFVRLAEDVYGPSENNQLKAYNAILRYVDESLWNEIRGTLALPLRLPDLEFIPLVSFLTRSEFWELVRTAAAALQRRQYVCRVPLNVVAALFVLYRLTVLPYINFRDVEMRLMGRFKSAPEIVDEDGTVILNSARAAADSDLVADFWKLLDVVELEFADDLRAARSTTESQQRRPLSVTLFIETQARAIAASYFDQMRLDRAIR
jgi:hypothetical protein